MARKKKSNEAPLQDENEDRPRVSVTSPAIRSEESPNRVVLRRKVNRPRPGDKVGYRPIVL